MIILSLLKEVGKLFHDYAEVVFSVFFGIYKLKPLFKIQSFAFMEHSCK